jgi:thiamine monophosphate synthase
MLIYHPAFDAYHCVFRMLAITESLRQLEYSKLRILDFYLCFPAEVAAVQLPQDHIELKKVARAVKNDYRGPVSTHRTFRDLESIQFSAARLLAASKIFDSEQLELGTTLRTNLKLPEALQANISSIRTSKSTIIEYILTKMGDIPLTGLGGLKQRTGLMEYRYDAA